MNESDDLLLMPGELPGLTTPAWVFGLMRYEDGMMVAIHALSEALAHGFSPGPLPIDIDRLIAIADDP